MALPSVHRLQLRLRHRSWNQAGHAAWADALARSDLAAVEALIQSEIWPEAGSTDARRASHPRNRLFRQAIAQGEVAVAERLLAAGALLEGGIPEPVLDGDDAPDTPLQIAVINGQGPMVAWLLAQGANPKVRTEAGNTLLHLALRSRIEGVPALLCALIEAGADPEQPNWNGQVPIALALQRGKAAYLQAQAGGLPRPDPQAALRQVLLTTGKVAWDLVDVLLAEGGSLVKSHEGQTLLEDRLNLPGLQAKEVVEWVKRGAQLDHVDAHGITLTHRLFVTSRYAHPEGWDLYRAFQEAGLPDQRQQLTYRGKTPLDVLAFAAERDHRVANGPFREAFLPTPMEREQGRRGRFRPR